MAARKMLARKMDVAVAARIKKNGQKGKRKSCKQKNGVNDFFATQYFNGIAYILFYFTVEGINQETLDPLIYYNSVCVESGSSINMQSW